MNFYDLMTTYVNLLSKHAQAVDPTVTAQTSPTVLADEDDPGPFLYIDTASARAGITAVNVSPEDLYQQNSRCGGRGRTMALIRRAGLCD